MEEAMNTTPQWRSLAILAAAAALAVAASCGQPGERPGPKAGAPKSAPAAFELEEATIAGLQEMMASGRTTAEKLVTLYLARIDAIDQAGPGLNAVIQKNPDALAIARGLDRERKDQGPRGPLHGIPVLIKDNIDTADGMDTTAGSL